MRKLKEGLPYKGAEGSITVFLSLILLLILSLILTVIEGARVNTAKVYADRALSTSMDSLLAQYDGRLWKEYHIFGYNMGEGSTEEKKDRISASMTSDMSYTFTPTQGLDNTDMKKGLGLFGIETDDLTISNETALTDYNGELLVNEAVEYMKYRALGKGMEALLDSLSLLETPEKVSYIMEKKQQAEEELVEIDKGVLRLMELLDGLMTSNRGVELNSDGSLKSTASFVKKICYQDITMDNVSINNESVFQKQRNSYVNPDIYYNTIQQNFTVLKSLQKDLQTLNQMQDNIRLQLTTEQSILAELSSKKAPTKAEKKQIAEVKKSIGQREDALKDITEQISEQEQQLFKAIDSIKAAAKELTQLINETTPLISKAITCINTIIEKTGTAQPLIVKYEELLNSYEGNMDEDTYQGLEENLKELKKYVNTDNSGYDFPGMKRILADNLSLLTETENTLMEADKELSQKRYEQSEYSFQKAQKLLTGYQIKNLKLDYSTLLVNKSESENPFKKAENLLQKGILSLVLDTEKVSGAELNSMGLLPSEEAAMAEQDTDFLSRLKEFFKSSVLGEDNVGLESLFGEFGDATQMNEVVRNGINQAAERILYQEYLKEHFSRYQQGNEEKENKPSVLVYEQEYLLTGKDSDQENLASVVSRIVFLRTVLDFTSLLKDKTKRSEAKLAAAALVGFTGLPVLVSITQVLILIVWAFAEALLDTCALMMGKEVTILKNNIIMGLNDLFLINRQYLQQKASQQEGGSGLSYRDYLDLFLLLKDKKDLTYLSMDLMQENIKLRYQTDNFQMKNCLFGYEAKARFYLGSKFTAISFMKKYWNNNPGGYYLAAEAACSY